MDQFIGWGALQCLRWVTVDDQRWSKPSAVLSQSTSPKFPIYKPWALLSAGKLCPFPLSTKCMKVAFNQAVASLNPVKSWLWSLFPLLPHILLVGTSKQGKDWTVSIRLRLPPDYFFSGGWGCFSPVPKWIHSLHKSVLHCAVHPLSICHQFREGFLRSGMVSAQLGTISAQHCYAQRYDDWNRNGLPASVPLRLLLMQEWVAGTVATQHRLALWCSYVII